MSRFSYDMAPPPLAQIGLILLQADETLESDLRRLIPQQVKYMVSRVPSSVDVSSESLQEIEGHLTAAAGLFPAGLTYDAVGYGCTSGTAQVGVDQVAARVRDGVPTGAVTQPLSALIAACRALDVTRLAMLSPYVAQVSARLRDALADEGIDTPVFGSFEEPSEAAVARIAQTSVAEASEALIAQARAAGQEVDALFLSCTNLQTLDVIAGLQDRLGIPVLSSNLVLCWHLLQLAAPGLAPRTPDGLVSPPDGAAPQ